MGISWKHRGWARGREKGSVEARWRPSRGRDLGVGTGEAEAGRYRKGL